MELTNLGKILQKMPFKELKGIPFTLEEIQRFSYKESSDLEDENMIIESLKRKLARQALESLKEKTFTSCDWTPLLTEKIIIDQKFILKPPSNLENSNESNRF